MNARKDVRAVLVAGVIATSIVLGNSGALAQSSARPITAENFTYDIPRGFGDRNNSWAQSMVWWQNHLYVGTGRQAFCGSMFAIWEFATGLFGQQFADTWLPYPPLDTEMSCAPDGADLSLQAEIWRWSPDSGWLRVFQSPLDLDNPGPGAGLPPRTGKKLPYEISIRGLTPHVEPDGTQALYAFGVNSTIMWDRSKLPPPRILRTTDGLNWAPVPQTPGTFLWDLPFNPDHSSFRSPVSYAGKLFVLNGPVFGQGSLIASADPAKGDDAWFLAGPPELVFYEMTAFNGWLYLGTFNPFGGGYSIVKTRAEGTPPFQFITVIPRGAYHPDPQRPSKSVVSMHVYNGRLYVGTATHTEIIRINPDDSWDLVVGSPRQVPLPDGTTEWKYPISGLDAGFGHSLNDHAWQMDDPFRFLYVGTYNASIASKDDPIHGPLLNHNMGAHLYRSPDGWYYSAITTDGFSHLQDPHGGRYDYGIRTMASTPHGAFFGTANDHYGLTILRAATRGSNAPDPPERLEVEPTRAGGALLSWRAAPQAKYRVLRALIHRILVRDDLNFEAWNGIFGNKIPDTYVGPYEQIGTTEDPFYVDATVEDGKRYMYYVVREYQGRVSDQSNLVAFPLNTPPVTFAQLLRDVDRWEARGRFANAQSGPGTLRAQLREALALAAGCRLEQAISALNPSRASNYLVEPESIDLEILLSKLRRRLSLAQRPLDVMSAEFCTGQ